MATNKEFYVKHGLKVSGNSLLNGSTYTDSASAKLHVKTAANGVGANLNSVNGLIVENSGSSDSNYALKLATGAGNIFNVTNSGEVGIGTTSTAAKLHLYTNQAEDLIFRMDSNSTGDAFIELDRQTSGGTAAIVFQDSSIDVWGLGTLGVDRFDIFENSSTARLSIIPGGNVGIGTTAPAALLDVSADTDTSAYIGRAWIGLPTGSLDYYDWAGFGHYNNEGYNEFAIAQNRNGLTRINAAAGQSIQFGSAGSFASAFTSAGRLGLGTTAPAQKLHVAGSTLISNNNYHYGYTAAGAQATLIGIKSNNYITVGQNNANHVGTNIFGGTGIIDFSTGGSTRMTLTSAGNVGIGTTEPETKLDVEGDTRVDGNLWLGGSSPLSANSSINTFSTGLIFKNNTCELGRMQRLSTTAGRIVMKQYSTAATAAQYPAFTFYGDENTGMYLRGADTLGFSTGGSSRMQIDNGGQLQFNAYGSGTHTGTQAYNLGVDSSGNIIEIDLGDGVIDGSGTANRLTYWSDSTTLTADSDLYYDSTNNYIGIGTDTPGEAIDIVGGNVQADEFIGNLRGAVLFRAKAGEALTKGDVVYISGISGNTTVVSKADADDAAKMPAFGIANKTASLNSNVDVIKFGAVSNLDTSAWPEGTELYVGTTAGALVSSAPTGESAAIQKIAKVTRQDNSAGSMTVMGAGRTNAVPNLNEGHLFVGNASNQAVSDNTLHVDIANSKVGIGNPADSGGNGALSSLVTLRIGGTGTIDSDAGQGLLQLRGYSANVNQNVGTIEFVDDRNGADDIIGRINSSRDTSIGDGNLKFSTATSAGVLSEAMRIDSAGNVGIGTTTPLTPLHVTSTGIGSNFISVQDTRSTTGDLAGIRFSTSANTTVNFKSFVAHIETGSNGLGDLVFAVDSNGDAADAVIADEKMRINSAGNVGIGTTPGTRLHVEGESNRNVMIVDATGTAPNYIFDVRDDGVSKFRVDGAGNVGIGTTSPGTKLDVSGIVSVRESSNIAFYGGNYIRLFVDSNFQIRNVGGAARLNLNTTSGDLSLYNSSSVLTNHIDTDGDSFFNGGNVGIGTTTPTEKFEIQQNGNYQLKLTNGSTGGGNVRIAYADNSFGSGGSKVIFDLDSGGSANAEFVIQSDGKVGIGTTTPAYGLDIRNSTTSQTGALYIQAALNSSGKGLVINSNTRTTADNAEHLLQIIDRSNSDSLVTTVEGITLAKLSTRLNTLSPLQVNSQIALGDSFYVYSTVQGGSDLTLTSNANPANIGALSNIKFKLGTSGGGGPNERMRIQSDGSIGVWNTTDIENWAGSTYRAIEFPRASLMYHTGTSTDVYLNSNTYYDGAWKYKSTEAAAQFILGASGDALIRTIASGTIDTSITWTTPFIVKNNGNVGIGTDSPVTKVSILQTAGEGNIELGNDGTGAYMQIYDRSTSAYKRLAVDALSYQFEVSNSPAVTILSAGNVGIGTTNPNEKLTVSGNISASGTVYGNASEFGAMTEAGLKTDGVNELPEGTVLVWQDGENRPCTTEADFRVMGVSLPGSDAPIVMGAEPVLITGPVLVGQFIITSDKEGHGKAISYAEMYTVPGMYHGKVIAQALESGDGESYTIKAMIRKM